MTDDPEQALVHKFATRYNAPAEMLLYAGGDRVVASFTPSRIVTNG